MLYSKLFGKTVREAPKEAQMVSNKLLHQSGFIRESTAGRYFFLPLGQIVQQKIMKVIKEEMDKAGAQEMVTPVLHPMELWKETNRTKTTGFELMTIKDRREADFVLGGTAEEMFVDAVRKFQISYKDLPFNIYQFSTKFRDELRARGGLLRVREFMMKDAYSFDTDEKEFKKEYEKMWNTYKKIFHRLGLETVVVESDNGYIGGDYCHEFVVESPIGESRFYLKEENKVGIHEEIAKRKNVDVSNLILKQGIEVGNIFQLGYYYSKKMKGATFIDQDGKEKPYYMGCYGIGIGRTMAAIVEKSHDDRGIIWPKTIAPYQAHLIGLDFKDESIKLKAHKIYEELKEKDIDVLFDDREGTNAGEKFADADLIGIPIRLVISKRTGDMVEYKKRNEKETKLLSLKEIINKFI
jgi:prolyl-tRNA synthetase